VLAWSEAAADGDFAAVKRWTPVSTQAQLMPHIARPCVGPRDHGLSTDEAALLPDPRDTGRRLRAIPRIPHAKISVIGHVHTEQPSQVSSANLKKTASEAKLPLPCRAVATGLSERLRLALQPRKTRRAAMSIR